MSSMDIGNSSYGDITNTGTNYSVPAVQTDAAQDSPETFYINTKWAQQLGYYKKIPELKSVIDAKATWTIGKGFKSNEITELALMQIRGNGKDSFNSILANMIRTYHIGGDAFAEIIRDKGRLVNLKPLDPGTIKIIQNSKGLIIRYEQISKIAGKDNLKFEPKNIFHLSRNRTADEIHGESLIDALEEIILMRNEAMADMRKLMHRYVKPRIVFKLDTDDATKITAFKVKADAANENGENLFIPMGAVEHEILAIPTNATLNPLPWINSLTQNFYQSSGVPQIIVGGSNEITEATAKILYMAFEQTVEEEQLYVEEETLNQLNLEINLEFPASLQNEMLTDMGKEESMQAATPEDTSITNTQVTPQQGVQ